MPDEAKAAESGRANMERREEARMKVIYTLLENGVNILCPDGVLISDEAVIGAGTDIYPGVVIKGKSVIGAGCTITSGSVIENSEIGEGTLVNASQIYDSKVSSGVKIGPFSHLRPNSDIKSGVKIGDFVEVKNSVVGEGTSIAHLTYIGDSDVGKQVNVGCGVVTVNYNGKQKARTQVGDFAFIGCNTNLVAPVSVGRGAYTAAGSTITGDVPDGSLAIARSRQELKDGWADRYLKEKRQTNKGE